MKKIAILGRENILGNGVIKSFLTTKAANYDLRIYNNLFDTQPKSDYELETRDLTIDSFTPWSPGTFQKICNTNSNNNPDYIINCLELEPSKLNDDLSMVYINSYFPIALSKWANKCGVKVIQVSSAKPPDSEKNTQYSLTKKLGEPNDCMTLRIDTPIGECPRGEEGILSYLNSFKETGEILKASPRRLLNNITNLEFGNVCKTIINKNLYEISSTDIFSPTPLPYFQIVRLLNEKYKLNIDIKPDNEGTVKREVLSGSSNLHEKLEIKHLAEQIKNL